MNNQPYTVEQARMRYALIVAVFGLGLSAALVVLLVFGAGMRSSADIVAIVGAFTGVSGTLVGSFFGFQIGSAGREQERAERRAADRTTQMAFGVMTEAQMDKVMEMSKGE
jgi:vacuolar-type H+-ATPase subunit I/STV1